MIFLLDVSKHIREINIKLLISIKNQIIKKSFKKIDRIEYNNKLKIIKNLEKKLKKIKKIFNT